MPKSGGTLEGFYFFIITLTTLPLFNVISQYYIKATVSCFFLYSNIDISTKNDIKQCTKIEEMLQKNLKKIIISLNNISHKVINGNI